MRLTWRDGRTTLFVAAAVVLYALWVTGTALTGMSTRAFGGVVFGLAWAACISNQNQMAVVYGVGGRRRAPMAYVVIASLAGVIALVAGVITLVSASGAMVATLVAATIALWAMSAVRHAIAGKPQERSDAARQPLANAA